MLFCPRRFAKASHIFDMATIFAMFCRGHQEGPQGRNGSIIPLVLRRLETITEPSQSVVSCHVFWCVEKKTQTLRPQNDELAPFLTGGDKEQTRLGSRQNESASLMGASDRKPMSPYSTAESTPSSVFQQRFHLSFYKTQ